MRERRLPDYAALHPGYDNHSQLKVCSFRTCRLLGHERPLHGRASRNLQPAPLSAAARADPPMNTAVVQSLVRVLAAVSRRGDIAVVAILLVAVTMIIVPLPTVLIDMLITAIGLATRRRAVPDYLKRHWWRAAVGGACGGGLRPRRPSR